MPYKTCLKEGKGSIFVILVIYAIWWQFLIWLLLCFIRKIFIFKLLGVTKSLSLSHLSGLPCLICCLSGFQCYECAGAGGTCATEEDLGLVCILLYSTALLDFLGSLEIDLKVSNSTCVQLYFKAESRWL